MSAARLGATVAFLALAGSACMDREGLQTDRDAGGAGRVGSTGGTTGTGGRSSGVGGQAGGAIDGGVFCGPTCDIYCQWGNVVDPYGCPTCACNPAPTCASNECPPPPPYAQPMCPNGKVVPPACTRSSDGTCSWTPPRCEVICPAYACLPQPCPYGTKVDPNGCPTCGCNPPPPACTTQECGPGPLAPNYVCPDGTVAGPVCGRAANGKCGWTIVSCPVVCPAIACLRACPLGSRKDANGCDTCDCLTTGDCAVYGNFNDCSADTRCTWLFPGCGVPALASQGCFSRADLGCGADTDCPGGRTCLKRVVNPCSPGAFCDACGVTETICL
jgi:hypothetical protein